MPSVCSVTFLLRAAGHQTAAQCHHVTSQFRFKEGSRSPIHMNESAECLGACSVAVIWWAKDQGRSDILQDTEFDKMVDRPSMNMELVYFPRK
jgi:hypothetical protein